MVRTGQNGTWDCRRGSSSPPTISILLRKYFPVVTLPRRAEAVVIGAGPNGLVAANLLADAGWEVLVLEAQPEPGGAVRSAELTHPGFTHDMFSAFYPLGVASPVMAALRLEQHGLQWRRAPLALAHPTADDRAAVLG